MDVYLKNKNMTNSLYCNRVICIEDIQEKQFRFCKELNNRESFSLRIAIEKMTPFSNKNTFSTSCKKIPNVLSFITQIRILNKKYTEVL